MVSSRCALLAAAFLPTLLALPAAAQTPPAAPTATWGVGLGLSVKRPAYSGIGSETRVIPQLSYENRWVRLAGPMVDFKLPSRGSLSLGLRARYALEDGYEPGDAPVLAGMAERKPGLWLGATAVWRSGFADLSAEWLGDAAGLSDGQRLRLMAERSLRQGSFQFTPRLALHWQDGKAVDYYYGVRASEATTARPVYGGSSTVSTELGLRTGYALSARQGLYLDLSATRLGSGIQNSPLVDRSIETAVRMGYLYRF